MAASIEIERKFLVMKKPDAVPVRTHKIRQGYIARENGNTVRIREKDGAFILCIKTASRGLGRQELEYEIPVEEGEIIFGSLNHQPIIKTREIYNVGNHVWEVDIFAGDNDGLIVAEVELEREDQHVVLPDWVGPEVTGLSKFYNANIANAPFNTWRISYSALIERMS